MRNSTDLVKTIREISITSMEATKPVALVFGNVINKEPIEINIDQKLTLTSAELACCDLSETVLELGDTLALLRQQGGQKYLIINKVVEI